MSQLKLEIKRKYFHVLFVSYFLIYCITLILTNSRLISIIPLVAIFLIFLILENLRIHEKIKIPFFQNLWQKNELRQFGGEIYYMLSIIIVVLIFNFKIASISILMLTFGDAVASVIGIAFGKHKVKSSKKKASFEGSIAELIVNLTIGFMLWQNWIIIPMAFTATLVETYIPKLDDNLTIPIITGLVGTLISMI